MHEVQRATPSAEMHRSSVLLRSALGLAIVFAMACGLTGRSQSSGGSNGGQSGGSSSRSSSGSSGGSSGQSTLPPGYGPPHQHVDSVDDPDSDLDPISAERRNRALNIERQKEMVSDANKLLKLARELNDEVASAHTETLTPDQLHKIAEIEKLAHSVKERMTVAVGPVPGLKPTPMIEYPVGR